MNTGAFTESLWMILHLFFKLVTIFQDEKKIDLSVKRENIMKRRQK